MVVKVQQNNLAREVCDTEPPVCDSVLGEECGGAQLSGVFFL